MTEKAVIARTQVPMLLPVMRKSPVVCVRMYPHAPIRTTISRYDAPKARMIGSSATGMPPDCSGVDKSDARSIIVSLHVGRPIEPVRARRPLDSPRLERDVRPLLSVPCLADDLVDDRIAADSVENCHRVVDRRERGGKPQEREVDECRSRHTKYVGVTRHV